jgi:hypothetical protein
MLVAADSASGLSAVIEHARVTAINADLSLSLSRPLEGEWVGLDSLSIYEPSGLGLADTRVHDVCGPIGRWCRASSSKRGVKSTGAGAGH